ncbi:hypothetical protein CFIO01_13714 [Colletotrichum fioriniae PJ7]|uniref:Uncharacterized protein n=1 Tax=Colletotrichum fioriniae PJ7 TaxID=1445577 RepID=A0A010QIR9_9PEZI|nr:hypothetical protein CFIO01_13714 [Colletotrichum fioriniae PJ7]
MNRAPITVPIWENATPINLQRAPIIVPIWQSSSSPSNKSYRHPQIYAAHILDVAEKLCQAARSPRGADVAYYVGLWEDRHDCHWNYMRRQDKKELTPYWPEFVRAKFGNSTDAVLKMVYRVHVNAVKSSSEWKLLIMFDRVCCWLGLSGPAMFLQLGPEVAMSPEALKIILKLLNHSISPTFSCAEILATIYQVMMQRNEMSETPTHPALRDVQEAQDVIHRHYRLKSQGATQDE